MNRYRCDNCGALHSKLEVAFPDIPHLLERIAPGEPVPAGECPDCGALCHLLKSGVISAREGTPGPWAVFQLGPDTDPEERWIVTTADFATEVCGTVENLDDARVLAAAPELLDALSYIAKKARTLAGWKLDPSGYEVSIAELLELESRALSAIVKAEGRAA